MELDGIKLTFEDDAIKEIAKDAVEKKSGARGLRGILEKTMLDVMFEMPSREDVEEVIITKDTVKGIEPATVIKKKK